MNHKWIKVNENVIYIIYKGKECHSQSASFSCSWFNVEHDALVNNNEILILYCYFFFKYICTFHELQWNILCEYELYIHVHLYLKPRVCSKGWLHCKGHRQTKVRHCTIAFCLIKMCVIVGTTNTLFSYLAHVLARCGYYLQHIETTIQNITSL